MTQIIIIVILTLLSGLFLSKHEEDVKKDKSGYHLLLGILFLFMLGLSSGMLVSNILKDVEMENINEKFVLITDSVPDYYQPVMVKTSKHNFYYAWRAYSEVTEDDIWTIHGSNNIIQDDVVKWLPYYFYKNE